MRRPLLLLILLAFCSMVAPGNSARAQSSGTAFVWFEQYLEALRQQAAVPGLSAAIVADGRIAWERGFGFQDIDDAARAEPDTPYGVADLTSTLSATLLLQCVERGTLRLDEPLADYGEELPERDATVRHVLTHTSQGNLGTRFRYDSGRFGTLADVIAACTDRPFRSALASGLLDRLGMQDSVPGPDTDDGSGEFDQETLEQYRDVLERLAKPYRVDRRDKPSPGDDPPGIDASTGLISTVRDLARFDAALDDRVLLTSATLAAAWSNVTARDGVTHPIGLGWFVQSYRGERIVWHFGLTPDAFSSLIIKVPRRGLTLILLANSDGLSAPFSLDRGDLTSSPFARLFLQLFL